MPEPMPLVRGTLDVLVLKTLSWGPMHSFEIIAWLRCSWAAAESQRRAGEIATAVDALRAVLAPPPAAQPETASA